MIYKRSVKFVLLMGMIFGCSSQNSVMLKSDEGEPVITVGDVHISAEGLLRRYESQPKMINQLVSKRPEFKEQFVEAQIRKTLLAKEALNQGYLEDPEVQEKLKGILAKRMLEKLKNDVPEPTQPELLAYYESHKKEYEIKDKSSFYYIKFKKEEEGLANRALKNLKNIKKDMMKTGFVDEESLKKSLGESVAKAAFALKTQEASKVLSGEDGLYVVLKEEEKKGFTKTFEQVKSKLQAQLKAERREKALAQLMDELKQKNPVHIEEKKLSEVSFSTP